MMSELVERITTSDNITTEDFVEGLKEYAESCTAIGLLVPASIINKAAEVLLRLDEHIRYLENSQDDQHKKKVDELISLTEVHERELREKGDTIISMQEDHERKMPKSGDLYIDVFRDSDLHSEWVNEKIPFTQFAKMIAEEIMDTEIG